MPHFARCQLDMQKCKFSSYCSITSDMQHYVNAKRWCEQTHAAYAACAACCSFYAATLALVMPVGWALKFNEEHNKPHNNQSAVVVLIKCCLLNVIMPSFSIIIIFFFFLISNSCCSLFKWKCGNVITVKIFLPRQFHHITRGAWI